MNDRRIQPRVAIDIDFCMLSHRDGAELVALIKDISRDGLCVELAAGDFMDLIIEGDAVTLSEFPEQMMLSTSCVLGQIAWRKGDYCGISFLAPLPAEHDALLYYRDRQADLSPFGMAS